MNRIVHFVTDNKRWILKTGAILVITMIACGVFFQDGLDRFYQKKSYIYQNDFEPDSAKSVELSDKLTQQFLSKGDFLSSVKIYIGENSDQEGLLNIEVKDVENQVVGQKTVSAADLLQGAWNTVSMDISNLKRGEIYSIEFRQNGSEQGIKGVLDSDMGDVPYLKDCSIDEKKAAGRLAVGINQVYHYFDAVHGIFVGINIVVLVVLLGMAAVSVLRLEEGISKMKEQGMNRYFMYPAFITMSILMMYNPMDSNNTDIKTFSRTMGAGIMSGYDISRVISNFTSWCLAAAVLYVIYAAYMAQMRARKYSEEQMKAWDFLDRFMPIACANLILRCITFFFDGGYKVFYYSSWIVLLILLTGFTYIFARIDQKISFSQYQSAVILAFSASFPIAALSNFEWQDGMLLLGVQYIVIAVAVFAIRFVTPITAVFQKKYEIVWSAALVAGLFPLMLSLYIEIVNIIVGRGIFITRIRFYYALSILLMSAAILVLYFVCHKRKKLLPEVSNFTYPCLISGIAMLSQQLPLTAEYSRYLTEGANAGILISDFLNFGDIPIVQHYGGNMMTRVWEGILYGLANNDYVGGAISPYKDLIIPVTAVIFYLLLKEVLNKDTAFWIVLLIPFYDSVSSWGFGLLVPFAAIKFIQKNTYLRASLIWLACLWVTLYRLDVGFAFDIACAVGLLCYVICEKNLRALKELGLTLAGYGLALGGLWYLLCFFKGINPLGRMLEFVMISASNSNWAYDSIGNPEYFVYVWCYLIIPLVLSVILLYVVISKKFRQKAGLVRWFCLIVVGASYFANIPRGLVRHSLREMALIIIIWTAYLFLALFISCFIKKEQFIIVFICFMLFQTLIQEETIFVESGIADMAVSKITEFRDTWTLKRFDVEDYDADTMEQPKTYWVKLKESGEQVKRIVIEPEIERRIKPLEMLCDILLEDDETYVDFMNRTLTYCLFQRRNPVYVSQSPLQLSGDYTQECFIREIAENPDSNPIVLMPYYNDNYQCSSSLDGLENNYRYYRVAEYIYHNYVPLCHHDEYTVWCLKSRYADMKDKLLNNKLYGSFECIQDLKNNENGLTMTAENGDSRLYELQKYMDLDSYAGVNIRITVAYEADRLGTMRMFYTEEEGENYSSKKVVDYEMTEQKGIAVFVIPVTEYTRLRFDIPAESTVNISSLTYGSTIALVEAGYDRYDYEEETPSIVYLDNERSLHKYYIGELALIWAELDKDQAIRNSVLSAGHKAGDHWVIENTDSIDKTKGNYLAFHISFSGRDKEGFTKPDDESAVVAVRIGKMDGDQFVELYKYIMRAVEGEHDYLIRVSTDYYWYISGTDMVRFDCDSEIIVNDVRVLQGD